MMKVKIAIPTYNRTKYILRLINTLIGQQGDFDRRCFSVEVYNNSNTRDDQIDAGLESLRGLGHEVDHTFNGVNIGFGKNIANAYTATSDWVWVIGDDDYLHPFALERVSHLCKDAKKELGAIVLGSITIDDDFRLHEYYPGKDDEAGLYIPADMITASDDIHHLAFLSALVVRSEVWNCEAFTNHYKDTSVYSHVFTILDGCTEYGLGIERIRDHIVFAGYGRNEYYAPKMAIAFLSEFCEYDKRCFKLGTKARRRKYRDYYSKMLRRTRLEIGAAIKVSVWRDTYYKGYEHLARDPQSISALSRILVRFIYCVTTPIISRKIISSLYDRFRGGTQELRSATELV